LTLEHLDVALDFRDTHLDAIEREIFFRIADLFRADVDRIFWDTTTVAFEIAAEEKGDETRRGTTLPPLRKRGYSQEGRAHTPQVVVGLALTRDGLPVRSWVFPGHTVEATTGAPVKAGLRGGRLGQAIFVGDAGMDSEANRQELATGLGHDILARPMGKRAEVQQEVLSRPGRYLARGPGGRLTIDAAAVQRAARMDGTYVLLTNDDSLTPEDLGLGDKAMRRIEACFRRLKTTGRRIRPVYHWTAHRSAGHVKLCVLALLLQRAAEIRTGHTWRNIRLVLDAIQAVRYRVRGTTIVQSTHLTAQARTLLQKLHVAPPPRRLAVER
jgi:hypothetical protein